MGIQLMCAQRMPIFPRPQGPRKYGLTPWGRGGQTQTLDHLVYETHPRERLHDTQSTQKPSPHVPHRHQAISQCEQSQAAAAWLRKESPGAGAGITCPEGRDSKESEQARARDGQSSGGRLSMDEKLLARDPSCPNMSPAEVGWAGGQEEQLLKRPGLGLTAWPGTSQTPNHHMGHRKEMQ